MPVASVTWPETPWGRERRLWRVGSQVWGPTAPLSTPRLLPYPPWPSCARMGVGVAVGALGLQKSHTGQKGPLSSLPSICLSLSLSSCFHSALWALC